MSLSQEELEALVAIVEMGSFRAAANHLHKAQSAISYSIKKLESKLRIKIFDRLASSVKLTEAGAVIYNKAKSIYKINEEIKSFSEIISEGIEAKISLVISPVTPLHIVTQILKTFNNKFPQTQIELSITTFEEPFESLIKSSNSNKSEADIAISSGLISSHPNLEIIKWIELEFMPVTSPDYPAAFKGIREEDLNMLCHLAVGGRSTVEKKHYLGETENAQVWSVNDFLVKRELLLNGLGWGHMPKPLIIRELEEGLLVKINVKQSFIKNLYIARRKIGFTGPASEYLWNLFLQECQGSLDILQPDQLQY